jgi:PQQ-like domain
MQRYRLYLFAGVTIFFLSSIMLAAGAFVVGQGSVHASPPVDDWTTYAYDIGHSGYNALETILNASTASHLKLQWSISEGRIVSTQASVANGLIYWGSWDGIEHASKLDGSPAWTANLGTAPSNCGGSNGVASTATIATVSINGTPTSVDFVGSANDQFFALNALTGATIWQTSLGTSGTQILWASPVLYNGSIYIAIASNDCPLIQAKIFQLNATTGAIQNTYSVVPNGCQGAGVWGTVTIDSTNNTLYFTTGNPGNCSVAETNADGVVQLSASNLAFMSSWQVPPAQQGSDLDFGSTPTVFTATIGGVVHRLIGVGSKNGNYYAFDEVNISQGAVWSLAVARSGPGPESGDGTIAPSAWDGTNLYVGGGATTINGQSCQGGLRALNPATGATVWAQCMTDGPILGPITEVPGVLAVGEGTALWLMSTVDGHTLFKTWDLSTGSKYYAGPTISNGVLYIGNKNGKFSAFGGLTMPTPTPSPSPTLAPSPSPTTATTLAQDTFQRANQSLWGTASDGHAWSGNANKSSTFSIVSNAGQVASAIGSFSAVLGQSGTNAQVLVSGSVNSFAKANFGAMLRWSNNKNWYNAYMNGKTFIIKSMVNGTLTTLASTTFTATAGISYTIRFQVVGSAFSAKVWPTGTIEPASWMVTATNSSLTSGSCGVHIQVQSTTVVDVTSFLATTA